MIIKYSVTPDEVEYLVRLLISLMSEKNRMHLD